MKDCTFQASSDRLKLREEFVDDIDGGA